MISKEGIVNKLFIQKVEEGGVVSWAKKRKSYMKYKKQMEKYEEKLLNLAENRFSEEEYELFKEYLQSYKGAIYDLEFEEKEYYFKEGQREGMGLIKELFL